jgi:outer membrane protein assembly factor BamB
MASSLAVSDGLLIVGALSGLNALRPTDGMLTHIWRYDEADFSGCAPAVVGGVVFSGGDVRGRTAVHAVDASDGGYIWKRQTHGLVSGRPAADSKLLYAADDEGYLTAFDLRSGEPHWAIPHHAPILGGPALRDGQVYVGGRNRYLHAYNAADGTELWSIPTKGWINRSAPVMADGLVIVGSADGYVHAVSTRGERIEVSPQQVDVRFNL